MSKLKYALIFIAVASLTSCGIFKKDCGCPHFSKNLPAKKTPSAGRYV